MSRFWCFTSFKCKEPQINDSRVNSYVYQRESCPYTGTLHWQGYVEFSEKIHASEASKVLRYHPAYLVPTRSVAMKWYCSKLETRVGITHIYNRS